MPCGDLLNIGPVRRVQEVELPLGRLGDEEERLVQEKWKHQVRALGW
jgi:hypothetical protein